MIKNAWATMALCACAGLGAAYPAFAAQDGKAVEARATITAFGSPVLEVRAAMDAPAVGDWDKAVVEIKILALVQLQGSTIASQAASRMRSGFGLVEEKAQRFEDGLAHLLGSIPAGGAMSARCAPGSRLTVVFAGKALEVGDEQTGRAFCGMWLSTSGQAELRAGLGFK